MSLRYRKNPYHQLFYTIKRRAEQKGIKFTLTKDDIKELFANRPKVCPILGIEIKYSELNVKKSLTDYSPSIDRLIPDKGYTKNNVSIISNLANRIKQDATVDQIEKVYKFLKNLK